jgi:fluoride exporter
MTPTAETMAVGLCPQAAAGRLFLLPCPMKKGQRPMSFLGSNLVAGYAIVFLGGGIGAAIRHGVNLGVARIAGTNFPCATMLINITGSIIMGLAAAYFAFKGEATQHLRLFMTTGILGGYTTFSAYSLDAALLYERGQLGLAAFYVIGSVVISIAGLFAGLAIVRNLT